MKLSAFVFILIVAMALTQSALSYQGKTAKTQPTPGLIGTWEATEEGETVRLVFKSARLLEFDGEVSEYRLVPGAIRVKELLGEVEYKYALKGDNLLVTFPEGEQLKFRRSGSLSTGNKAKPEERRGTGSASSENHLLVGKFMSYSSASSSTGSSSWTTYATFDGRGNFTWDSESAHSTSQYNQQGNQTGSGLAYGSNSGNSGTYRVVGDRIIVTFPDGSTDEGKVSERFADGSIGAFKYAGKTYAR